ITQVTADDNVNLAKGYHNYSALTKALKELAIKKKKITKLTSIGKTLNDKDILMLQISGEKGPNPEAKQALLICGNLEGDHVIGSEVALTVAEYLIDGYGNNEEVTNILDKRTFYIVPRLNPDGAELFFEKTLNEHQGNLRPRDDDYDWKSDEDGPEDLNGDGMITVMRVKDKEGNWYIDKKDPRLMLKKEKDTSLDSLFKIYPEGIDNDGDELYNEDGLGGYNINRNFTHNFGYEIKGYTLYPASESGTRALIDFMNRYIPELKNQPHKNICGVLLFSKYDNLAGEPGIQCGEPMFPEVTPKDEPTQQMFFRFQRRRSQQQATQRQPRDPQPKKTDENDLHLFKKVSEQYKKITGIKDTISEKPVGSLLEWGYFLYGVPTFSANLWSVRKEKPDTSDKKVDEKIEKSEAKPEKVMDQRSAMRQKFASRIDGKSADKGKSINNDQKWLNWIDNKNNGKGFVKWAKFQHKQLGEVEIGGFQPYLRVNPPADQIKSLGESHARFALYLAEQFAEIMMDEPEVEKLSSNLFELKVKVHNKGKFPYATAMGQKSSNVTPILLQLKFEDDENMKLFGGSKRNDLNNLDAGAEKEFKWIIISPLGKKIDISLWARKGGGKFYKKVILE
ncbi:MAG: hypothetical protein JSW07_15725, partial [bacterium]